LVGVPAESSPVQPALRTLNPPVSRGTPGQIACLGCVNRSRAPFGPPVLDGVRNAHDVSDTRRPGSADQCLGPSRSACPGKGNPGSIWSRPLNRAGSSRLRLGLASRRVAGPLGLLALGRLLPELVISAGGAAPCILHGRCRGSDLALVSLPVQPPRGWAGTASVSGSGQGRHERRQSQLRPAN
jgi:hypothetical protein